MGRRAERAVGGRECEALRRVRRLWRALRRRTVAASAACAAVLPRRGAVAAVIALGELVVSEAAQVKRMNEGKVGHLAAQSDGKDGEKV